MDKNYTSDLIAFLSILLFAKSSIYNEIGNFSHS